MSSSALDDVTVEALRVATRLLDATQLVTWICGYEA